MLLAGAGGGSGQGPDRDSGFDSKYDEKPLEDLCRAVSVIIALSFQKENLSHYSKVYHWIWHWSEVQGHPRESDL